MGGWGRQAGAKRGQVPEDRREITDSEVGSVSLDIRRFIVLLAELAGTCGSNSIGGVRKMRTTKPRRRGYRC